MQIELSAAKRTLQGTSASRRLRRAGRVPGILYGGTEPALADRARSQRALSPGDAGKRSKLPSSRSIWTGRSSRCCCAPCSLHPYKTQVQHIDFQRVLADRKIRMKVPLHFVHAEASPAVKVAGAVINHVMNYIDISCLPADLPEFIEVDLSEITIARFDSRGGSAVSAGRDTGARSRREPSRRLGIGA